MIHIAATQYSINYQAFEIYLSGCKANPHCKDCHNPELWKFDIGAEYNIDIKEQIIQKINSFSELISNIWILGGEPLDQDIDELIKLINDLRSTRKKIWLFTRYEIKEIPKQVKTLVDYVKCGRYIPEQSSTHVEFNVMLSSDNQHIYKIDNKENKL
jgi:anaerobic ribonucleoside-triphosphate reductase activating protein